MSNRRLLLLVLAMLGLGALVWLDRRGGSEGNEVEEARRPPTPSTGVASRDPAPASPRDVPIPSEPLRTVEPPRAVDLPGPAASGPRRETRRVRSDVDADGSDVDADGSAGGKRANAAGVEPKSSNGDDPKAATDRDDASVATAEADAGGGREATRAERSAAEDGAAEDGAAEDGAAEDGAAEDGRAAGSAKARARAEGEKAADDGEGPGAFPDDEQGEKHAEVEPAAVATRVRRARREAVTPRPLRGDGTSTNPWAGVPLDKLGAIVERPLFEPSRRAWRPPPPPPPVERVKPPVKVAPPPDPSMLVLMGITAGSGRAIAIVQNNSTNRVQHVEEGEYIDGWEVRSVGSREVVISKEGVTAKLQLNTRPRL